jgi:hypothetical protein
MYGIASPAPICTDDSPTTTGGQLDCQVLQAPDSANRLVASAPSTFAPSATADRSALGSALSAALGSTSSETEIRLTYRELTALIEDALRALK